MAPAQSKMLNPLLSDNACCVVCDKNKQIIECPNGHHQCLCCSMKRYQIVYNGYMKSKEGGRPSPSKDIKCFMCRTFIEDVEDQVGTKLFYKMVNLVLLKEYHQKEISHYKLTPEIFNFILGAFEHNTQIIFGNH